MKRTGMTLGWLVGAAARKAGRASMRGIVGGAMMAAALVLGMTACSSDETIADEAKVEKPTAQQGTIHVTVGAGISDPTPDPSPTMEGSSTATRSHVVESEYEVNSQTRTRRTLTFTLPVGEPGDENYSPGDRLYIHGDITRNERRMGGLLTITSVSNDGKSATFEGDLTVRVKENNSWKVDDTGWAAQQTGDPMTWYGENTINGHLIHAATANSDFYKIGSDGNFSFNHNLSFVSGDGDLANKLMESAIEVNGWYNTTKGCFELDCSDAIFNCTFSGLEANTEYYVCIGYSDSEVYFNNRGLKATIEYDQTVTTDGEGTARFAIGTNKIRDGYHVIQLCTDKYFTFENDHILNCIFGQRLFEPRVYNVNRYLSGSAFTKTIDLASISSDLKVMNGLTLTGELSDYHKISIAPGATVTLSGARIPGRNASDASSWWAGITCLGDATIVLAEGTENYAKGYHSDFPGIQAGPTGTTLTIRGSGTLTAETGLWSDGTATQGFGAGIGGRANQTAGNIRIEGGNITARGNDGGAGIGSGCALNGTASCGDITITDGNITAEGGYGAAGIGSGKNIRGTNTCGNITIDSSVTGMAIGGEDSSDDIGAGNGSTCGTVTMTGVNDFITCTFNVKYYQSKPEGRAPIEAYSATASKIRVTVGGWTYNVTGSFQNNKTVTIELPETTNATITITSPNTEYYEEEVVPYGAEMSTATFSATLTGIDITEGANLGTLELVKVEN